MAVSSPSQRMVWHVLASLMVFSVRQGWQDENGCDGLFDISSSYAFRLEDQPHVDAGRIFRSTKIVIIISCTDEISCTDRTAELVSKRHQRTQFLESTALVVIRRSDRVDETMQAGRKGGVMSLEQPLPAANRLELLTPSDDDHEPPSRR